MNDEQKSSLTQAIMLLKRWRLGLDKAHDSDSAMPSTGTDPLGLAIDLVVRYVPMMIEEIEGLEEDLDEAAAWNDDDELEEITKDKETT